MAAAAGSSGSDSDSGDAERAVRRKMGVRGLLLRYLLYDSLVRPDEWQFALLHDMRRRAAWDAALRRALAAGGAFAVALPGAGELPTVPLLLARAISEQTGGRARAYEPMRPVAAALQRAARHNGVAAALHVAATEPSSDRVRAAPSGGDATSAAPRAALVAAPALEDAIGLRSALEQLSALRNKNLVATGDATAYVPHAARLMALPVELPPSQVQPVRSPLGTVSGFDLTPFNTLRPTPCSDRERLRDVKHARLADAIELVRVRAACDGPAAIPCKHCDDATLEGGEGRPAPPLRASVRASSGGRCNAVALWTEVALAEGDFVSFDESRRCVIAHLAGAIDLCAGEDFELLARFDVAANTYAVSASTGSADARRNDGAAMAALTLGNGAEGGGDDKGGNSAPSASVSRWHFGMVNDGVRNDVYERALAAAIAAMHARRQARAGVEGGAAAQCRVLDIGAGSGLLGMMAARHGASEVCCVEVVSAIAAAAREVINANALTDRIDVVESHSTKLTSSDALGFRGGGGCDILVSEVLDDGLLGEHVIPTVAHARRTLCAPDAMVIPARASVVARLVHIPQQAAPLPAPSAAFAIEGRVESSLDVNAYDALRPKTAAGYVSIRTPRIECISLSAPKSCLDFDFNAPLDGAGGGKDDPSSAEYSRRVSVPLVASRDGVANAVVFHFTLDMLPKGVAVAAAGLSKGDHAFTSAPADGECTVRARGFWRSGVGAPIRSTPFSTSSRRAVAHCAPYTLLTHLRTHCAVE